MAYIKLLKDVPLDNSYSNPILFGNATLPSGFSKVNYNEFFSKFDTNWQPSSTDLKMNIRVGDGINTTIIIPEEQWQPSYNYAIISFDDNEVKPCSFLNKLTTKSYYFFYFITNCVPLGKGNYVITLELDVLTTYLPYMNIDHKLFTERKHCNRWVKKYGNYLLSFKDAILGDNIDTNFNSTLIKSQIAPVYYKYVNENSCESGDYELINEFLTKYQWVYLFYTSIPTTQGDIDTTNLFTMKYSGKLGTTVDSELYCIAIPTYNITIKQHLGSDTKTEDYGVNTKNFRELIQAPSCISAKLSNRSPFVNSITYPKTENQYIKYNSGLEISFVCTDGGSYTHGTNGNITYMTTVKDNELYKFLLVRELPTSLIQSNDIDLKETIGLPYFTSTELNNYIKEYKVNKNDSLEPKLYCKPFYNLKLSSQYGIAYNYNPLLINDITTHINVYNTITPESEKTYCYMGSSSGSPYNYYKDCNIGSAVNNDNNIPFRQDAYKEYLSRNKASIITGLAMPVVSGVVSSGTSVVGVGLQPKPNYSGMVQGISQNLMNMGNQVVNYASNIVDLQNTPDSIKNMGNNPIHDFTIGNYTHPYLIEETLFDNEKQQVFDYFYDNGYKVNRKCNIDLHDFSNTEQIITRQKFNYIKIGENFVNEMKFVDKPQPTLPITTTLYLPQVVKQKINLIFNKGFKLWTLIYANVENANWEDFYLGSDFENAEIVLP